MTPGPSVPIHASAVVIGEVGVLIRGPSGAGKSALALALIDASRRSGAFARLIGDDRILLTLAHSRLLMRPHPLIAGQVERRWEGVSATPYEGAVVLRCVVDLAPAGAPPPRMPEPGGDRACVEGVELPRLALPCGGGAEAARITLDFLARLSR